MTRDIQEDDLHAYVDGKLAAARRLEVEAWLAAHPRDAARVNAWLAQNRALHAGFDRVLNEPVPLDLVRAARRHPARTPQRAAAAVLALVATGLVGYGLGQRSISPARIAGATVLPAFVRSAAVAHAVFTPEARHPVEVEAAQADHLVGWLSRRLGAPIKAPNLAALGFEMLGGRLLSGENGPVAQFMYQDDQGRRVTLYVRHGADDSGHTAFRFAKENGVDVFYWIDGEFGYALSGQIERSEMRALADASYRQLSPPAPH